MAKLADTETGELLAEGVWLVGEFLGVKHPAPYEVEGRKGTSKPKLGLAIYGQDYSVVATDGVELREALGDSVKGQRIAVKAYPVAGRYGLRWSLSPTAAGGWD